MTLVIFHITVWEQMIVVLIYVNKCGEVIEQFLDMVHVTDTSSKCLKDVIVASFAKYDLSVEVERSRI